jgi:hypothetical protein
MNASGADPLDSGFESRDSAAESSGFEVRDEGFWS